MKTSRLLGIDLSYVISLMATIAMSLFFVVGDRGNYLSHEHYFPFLDIFPAWFIFMNGLTTTLSLRDRRISSRKLFSFTSKKGSMLFLIGLVFCPVWAVNIFVCCGIFYMLAPQIVKYSTSILGVFAILLGLMSIALINLGVPTFVHFSTIELSGSGPKEFIGFFLFNGYFSVLPWAVFFIVGLMVGRSHLQMKSLIGPSNMISFILITAGVFLEKMTSGYYVNREITGIEGNIFLLQNKFFLPGFVVFACGVCILLTNLCIYVMKDLENRKSISLLNAISGSKYSIYVIHLLIGLFTTAIFTSESFKNRYVILVYIVIVCYACIWSVMAWKKRINELAPIEWMMKRLSGSVRN